MKQSIYSLSIIMLIAFVSSCSKPIGADTTVILSSKIDTSTEGESSARTVAPSETLPPSRIHMVSFEASSNTMVSNYSVTFKKIEISWDGEEIYTLWKNANGEKRDLLNEVFFTNITAVPSGNYRMIRFTIDETISVAGSVDTNADGTYDISGEASTTIAREHIFVTDDVAETVTHTGALTEAIEIDENVKLSIIFGIKGTVSYSETNGLSLDGPSVSITREEGEGVNYTTL